MPDAQGSDPALQSWNTHVRVPTERASNDPRISWSLAGRRCPLRFGLEARIMPMAMWGWPPHGCGSIAGAPDDALSRLPRQSPPTCGNGPSILAQSNPLLRHRTSAPISTTGCGYWEDFSRPFERRQKSGAPDPESSPPGWCSAPHGGHPSPTRQRSTGISSTQEVGPRYPHRQPRALPGHYDPYKPDPPPLMSTMITDWRTNASSGSTRGRSCWSAINPTAGTSSWPPTPQEMGASPRC